MARKPLNSIDWMQKNVDEIFAAPINEMESSSSPYVNVHDKIEQYERKAGINFNKNRRAPPPPGTKIDLPKIGNYQPKILLTRNNSKAMAPKSPYEDVRLQETDHLQREQSFKQSESKTSSFPEHNSECNIHQDDNNIYSTIDLNPDYDTDKSDPGQRKCIIMGDKDIPLTMESTYFGGEDESQEKSPQTDNKETKYDFESNNVLANHDALVNVGEVVVNPLFDGHQKENDSEDKLQPLIETNKHPYKKRRAPVAPSSYINRHRRHSHTSHESDEEYPYIPEPDYEEDEATMNFEDSLKRDKHTRRNHTVIKEYEGDDFAKYMDEDDGFHEQSITWRKNIRHVRSSSPQKKQPVSKGKRTDISSINSSKLKPMKKSKNNETKHGSIKRNTLRNISYADCKMGVDDRTIRSVKSTSAGGRYVKRGKERTMIIDGDVGGGSYEEFLKMRHKEDGSLESNSSGDSGLDIGDEQLFYKMQPQKVREGKGNLWEKLTWRFKRHVGGYRMS